MTPKRLTPIELMIDQATGFRPVRPGIGVTMWCLACGKERTARRDRSDPPNTAIVQFLCHACAPSAEAAEAEVVYSDGTGAEIGRIGKTAALPPATPGCVEP